MGAGPSILSICTDQQRFDTFGCRNAPKTRNIPATTDAAAAFIEPVLALFMI
jgi:hypothetical protein